MSKEIDNIIKEIAKSNKQLQNVDSHLTKDINGIKQSIKTIETKLRSLESKIDQAIDILNTFTILISDQDEDLDSEMEYGEEREDWNPYDSPEDYDTNDYDDEDE